MSIGCKMTSFPCMKFFARIIVATFLLTAMTNSGNAMDSDQLAELERFQLWTGCKTMDFFVTLDMHETVIDLDREKIEAVVGNRFKEVGLNPEEAGNLVSLLVYVGVTGSIFRSDIEFYKLVTDSYQTGIDHGSITWRTGALGPHGGNPETILETVKRNMDDFLGEYLKVNADSC